LQSSAGDGVRIANFRYPVAEGVERKGIVHYVHGGGFGTSTKAILGQRFAMKGYEFCGIDWRGWGESGGEKI